MQTDEKEMQSRVLHLLDCENFRELGGYVGAGGRRVKHGIFYRTGMLRPFEDHKELIRDLGVRAILDFRSNMERKQNPDPVFDGIDYYPISAIVAMDKQEVDFDLGNLARHGTAFLQSSRQFVEDGYHQMPFDSEAYRTLFRLLLEEKVPLLFHCTAGKDRTGFAAALILYVLGAGMDTIMQDYLYTNKCRIKAKANMVKNYGPLLLAAQPDADPEEVFGLVAGVRQSSLEASFAEIRKKYGNMETYLWKEFSVGEKEIEKMRRMYLE